MPPTSQRLPTYNDCETPISVTTSTISDRPIQKSDVIVAVVALILAILVISTWVKLIGLPRYRRHQALKTEKEKVTAGQVALQSLVSPIYRKPIRPILARTHSSSSDERSVNTVQCNTNGNTRKVLDEPISKSVKYQLNVNQIIPKGQPGPKPKPVQAFDFDFCPHVDTAGDIGLEFIRRGHQSLDTVDSVASICVAIEVPLPAACSAAKIECVRKGAIRLREL
ncbi:hypothetical protein GQ44DRAFT_726836 [Phaeosphaeriaceae sp. PMI808]|nr:hypothetical protein GQ44DRAFT_726836 [Phaeosphaeriaceae sp. PMI808]